MSRDDIEVMAEALNEMFGTYPWNEGADKAVWRLRAKALSALISEIEEEGTS